MKKIFLFVLMAISLSACAQDREQIASVSADEFQKYIEKYGTDQLIDVRTPQEFKAGHIPGAKLVNIYAPTFKQDVLKALPDKEKPVLVYCRSGNRSMVAARFLAEKGYRVINLKYGIKDWIRQNKPIKR